MALIVNLNCVTNEILNLIVFAQKKIKLKTTADCLIVSCCLVDLWVDRAEPHFRYAELDAGGRRILLPMTLAMVSADGSVNVKSIRSDQFAQVPGLSNPDQVTLQEEDRITAFYGGGHLYALPMRSEPMIWV